MKKLNALLVLGLMFAGVAAHAEAGLEDQMNDLRVPENTAPVGMRSEQLYSVQPRYTDLAHRVEFDIGGAHNFTSNSSMTQSQMDLTARYNFNDRWNVAVSGGYGFNSFTDSANRMIQQDGIVPDAAVIKWRADALVGYNLFYGKFRVSMDQVFYFDQYVAIGPGLINTQYQTAIAGVADVGVALWFSKNFTARIGLKNDVYNEQRLTSSGTAYNLLGHIDIGYLIGGESHYE